MGVYKVKKEIFDVINFNLKKILHFLKSNDECFATLIIR